MPRVLSKENIDRYHTDGFCFPVRVLTDPEAAEYLSKFEDLEASITGAPRPVRQPHLEYRWAYRLAIHPTILDAVEDVLGPEILVHSTLIFYKTAGSPAYVSWHQDGLYAGLRQPSLTTAWIALTDSKPDNGCMRVIPGSHRLGILPHTEIEESDNLLRRGQTIVEADDSSAVDVVLKPGEMSLHQINVIHGSNPTRSTSKRVGFIVRYATPEMSRIDHPVLQARGSADCSHLGPPAVPPSGNSR